MCQPYSHFLNNVTESKASISRPTKGQIELLIAAKPTNAEPASVSSSCLRLSVIKPTFRTLMPTNCVK